jgi:hypothetical protein
MPKELGALRDIHLPEPISWWPPAPGIIIGSILLLIMCGYLVFYFSTQKTRKIKQMALEQLSWIEKSHHQNTAQTIAEISILLKQVALTFYPRTEVASLDGEAWILFLSKTSKNLDFKRVQNALLHLAYAPEIKQSTELPILIDLARRWIQQRSNRCSN